MEFSEADEVLIIILARFTNTKADKYEEHHLGLTRAKGPRETRAQAQTARKRATVRRTASPAQEKELGSPQNAILKALKEGKCQLRILHPHQE